MRRKMAALAVVVGRAPLFQSLFFFGFQLLVAAKAVIGLAVLNEFFSVFLIDVLSLALPIGAILSARIRSLIPIEAEPPHVLLLHFFKLASAPRRIRVFNT